MKIGVLAVQGAFIEHEKMLLECGAETFEIRKRQDIDRSFDGLILPGGESTVMGKLLRELDLMEPVKDRITGGVPVMGTCAGLILLAEHISGDDTVHIGTMGITAKRNAYGRQLGSFHTCADFKGIGNVPMTFIRAPYIESVSTAEILAETDGKIVAARDKNQLAVAFHPELDDSPEIHQYFLKMI
ncbi:MAG: pyridoxal 5'-phosphate synthase glutaminase subunit PdxT [Porcipelethomonas sp.]